MMIIYGVIDDHKNVIFCGTQLQDAVDLTTKLVKGNNDRGIAIMECVVENIDFNKINEVYDSVRNGNLLFAHGSLLDFFKNEGGAE